jgi:hypothetical protein
MKKILLMLSLFSILLTSCELAIGDNVNCSCKCCGESQTCTKEETTTNTDYPTDEYNIEEDTTLNY